MAKRVLLSLSLALSLFLSAKYGAEDGEKGAETSVLKSNFSKVPVYCVECLQNRLLRNFV